MNGHWDACAPLRHSSLVQANPPGTGLVTHRRTAQVHKRMHANTGNEKPIIIICEI